jgi:glycosyltransferase involved in cell wall biosynthesis
MRIGIDARLWNETGVGRYIRNLVWQLAQIDKKNDYVLFVTQEFKIEDLGFTSDKWKIVPTDIRWHTVDEQLVFHKVIENEALDLVHFPYFSIPILYKNPFVITIHDLIINHFPTGKASTLPFPLYNIKRFGYQYVIKQAAKKAQKILTVSDATKNEIVDHLKVSKEKIVVTYEGIDSSIIAKTDSGQARMTGLKGKYFLYVGNAYPHKNLERLVASFALLHEKDSDVKLVLVGQKNYFYNQVEEIVRKKGLEKSIIFTGKVDDNALASLYKNAQALVFPSLMEGFGLPGLEAMQSGCLVLASDIPALKEMYEDAAVYFDPLDPQDMSDTMQKVLENPTAFKEYIKKGKDRAKTFSWEKMAKETLKVYEDSISLR